LKDFSSAIDLGGNDEDLAELWFSMAKVYLSHKKYSTCATALAKVEKLADPLSNVYLFSRRTRAVCYLRENQIDKALEMMDYILTNTTHDQEPPAPTKNINYIGIRNKNLGDLHIDTRIFRANSCYMPLKRYDDALADLEFVIKHRKDRHPMLFPTIIQINNEKYGINKLFTFSPQPAPLPSVDAPACEAMLANYKQLLKKEAKTGQIDVEINIWRAVASAHGIASLEDALRGIEEALHKEYIDARCLALAQLHAHLGQYEAAIADCEEMFAQGETELADHEIACVLHLVALCAVRLRRRAVALRALDEIPNLDPQARDTAYYKELRGMAEAIKGNGT